MKQKKVIIVAGPTASGKTSLAIRLALQYNTEIISCDSRQCYRELNIGVAKPSPEELATVKHHFVNSHSIMENVNAATFANYAHDVLGKLFHDHDVVIMVGGTGLYIKAFAEGLDNIPDIPADIRNEVRSSYREKGMEWLKAEVKHQDPEYFATGEIENPHRMMRALEVKLATGSGIRDFQLQKQNDNKGFAIEKYALDIPRQTLYQNIDARVDKMMHDGLEVEARSLFPLRHLGALQTVGYSELFDYFVGSCTLHFAIEKIKQNTRRYAKRQLTWFRKDEQIKWIAPGSFPALIKT